MGILEFITSPEVKIGAKALEIVYVLIGLILIYVGVLNAKDKENSARFGTASFWLILGVVMAFGRWMPEPVVGVLVILMALPPIFNRVKVGTNNVPTAEYTKKVADRIGYKVFVPALTIGLCAVFFAIFVKALGALVGVAVGVLLAAIMLHFLNKENTLPVFLADNKRLLDIVGPLCMLPIFLASLGAVFTASGVGEVISAFVGHIVPAGNVNLGIVVYGIGMVLFTMIMGNAFAAITVMTVGVGGPLVLAYGANPVVIGMVALTTGYCGTLMTPMAANFNLVPVAILEMKDRNGVIKNQIVPALIMLTVQIIYMIIMK